MEQIFYVGGEAMTFVGVLETIGKGFVKGLKWALEYAVPVERLAALLFPAAAPALTEVADATALIQNAVLLVEQKYAAAGVQQGTGEQKLAEVLLLTGSTVAGLLNTAGIRADRNFVARLISAVVAILNVQNMPAETTSASS